MNYILMDQPATYENFDEDRYLLANPDVAKSVKCGVFPTGKAHFDTHGKKENRKIRSDISEVKKRKAQKLLPLLHNDMSYMHSDNDSCYDFLTDDLRKQFNIIETEAVSSNEYTPYVFELIDKYSDGLLLDAGAGRRTRYFENVVNFEIVNYDTTDVRGVVEVLPFKDNSFDGVISLNVLEHVKDPCQCAAEMMRVLKVGGQIICTAAFLQPVHGYPHHYYNMTDQGLRNLFEKHAVIDSIFVGDSVLPIFTLTWMLRSWCDGLSGRAQRDFKNLKVSDLLLSGEKYLNKNYVRELSAEKNLELASCCVLFAHKERA